MTRCALGPRRASVQVYRPGRVTTAPNGTRTVWGMTQNTGIGGSRSGNVLRPSVRYTNPVGRIVPKLEAHSNAGENSCLPSQGTRAGNTPRPESLERIEPHRPPP